MESMESLACCVPIFQSVDDMFIASTHNDAIYTLHTHTHTQHEQQLNEAKAMARNRNLLGSRTVHALQFITKDTRQAFVSPALVDRMAAMLNYMC